MRDIEFKAKETFKNIWVYGYLCKNLLVGDYMISKTFEPWFIQRNTVCQYTGLIDKNGNKIYENDIVQYNGIKKGYIYFDKYRAAFMITDFESEYFCCPIIDVQHNGSLDIEVIGNIHDNVTKKKIFDENNT